MIKKKSKNLVVPKRVRIFASEKVECRRASTLLIMKDCGCCKVSPLNVSTRAQVLNHKRPCGENSEGNVLGCSTKSVESIEWHVKTKWAPKLKVPQKGIGTLQ